MQILLLISKNTVLDFEGLKEKLAPSITDKALTDCLEELLAWGWVQGQKGVLYGFRWGLSDHGGYLQC